MPALTAQRLRKSFGPQLVLDDASFSLARDEKVALIGANGAGKSTLAKILAGQEVADGGVVQVRRGLRVSYLSQEPVLDPTRTARLVVEDALGAWRAATDRHAAVSALLGEVAGAAEHDALLAEQAELDDTIVRLGGWDRGHVALDLLDRLGVTDVDAPVGPRSGGERRRIALAQLLAARPDVAILDEPTNHLDADTAEWLENHLANDFPGAIVLVTHDRYFLDAIATRIVELERGKLASYPGRFEDYLTKKAELLAHEERTEQNRQNILRRERAWLARGPKARATKQKARIQRAHALEAEGSATAGRPGQVVLQVAGARQGKTILELRGLEVASPGDSTRLARVLTAPFDLFVTAGERIGVIGPNGVGKTTLLRLIQGEIAAAGGEVVMGKNTRVAYVDQARAGLDDTLSIFDEVRGETGTTVTLGTQEMDLRSYLELFLFDAGKQRQKVGALSGGERARVALAKALRHGANLLLFDEPTNDLDLPTLAALEELLIGASDPARGAISCMVVTHDRAFLDRVATALLSFEVPKDGPGPATIERHAGGYEDYRNHKAALRAEERENQRSSTRPGLPAVAVQKPTPKTIVRTALTYGERLELQGMVAKIEAAETKVVELERALSDPRLYSTRGSEVPELQTALERARASAAKLVARWEELEARNSA